MTTAPTTPTAPDFVARATTRLPCTTDPQLFHAPDDGRADRGPDAHRRTRHAKALCHTCPLIAACRQWARDHDEVGVWGAEDDNERARATGYRPPPATPPQPTCGTPAGAQWHRRYDPAGPCRACLRAESTAKKTREEGRAAAWPPHLTPRQLEVLALWCSGLDIRELRGALGISARSVGGYLLQLRRALRVDTNADIGPAAQRLGLAGSAGYGKAA